MFFSENASYLFASEQDTFEVPLKSTMHDTVILFKNTTQITNQYSPDSSYVFEITTNQMIMVQGLDFGWGQPGSNQGITL